MLRLWRRCCDHCDHCDPNRGGCDVLQYWVFSVVRCGAGAEKLATGAGRMQSITGAGATQITAGTENDFPAAQLT